MAPVDQISKWLRKKSPYSYGVELLIEVNGPTRMNQMLLFKPTDRNLKKVVYELEKILLANGVIYIDYEESEENNEVSKPKRVESHAELQSSTQSVEEEPEVELPTPIITSNNIASPVPALDVLTRIKSELKRYFKERGHYHGLLHAAEDDDSRYDAAKKIMRLQSKIDAAYLDIDRIEAGNIPQNQIMKELTAEDYKRIQNLKTYIARYKRKLSSATDPGSISSFNKKLEDYQKELNTYYNA